MRGALSASQVAKAHRLSEEACAKAETLVGGEFALTIEECLNVLAADASVHPARRRASVEFLLHDAWASLSISSLERRMDAFRVSSLNEDM